MQLTKKKSSKFIALAFVVIFIISAMSFTEVKTQAASTPSATSITSITGYSKAFIIEYKKVSGVTGYQIQYSKTSSFSTVGNYYVSGASNTSATVNTVKYGDKTYYVRVRTYKKSSGSYTYSSWSSVKSVYVSKQVTAFGGDSIMYGVETSGISKLSISGSYKWACVINMNYSNFCKSYTYGSVTRNCYSIIKKAQPYRLYINLGMNVCGYSSSYCVEKYTAIIEKIQAACPATDIVILSCTPTTKSGTTYVKQSYINSYNKNVAKVVAANCGVAYYDIGANFKNSSGYLKSSYDSGDHIHLTTAGYKYYASLLSDYDSARDTELATAAKTIS